MLHFTTSAQEAKCFRVLICCLLACLLVFVIFWNWYGLLGHGEGLLHVHVCQYKREKKTHRVENFGHEAWGGSMGWAICFVLVKMKNAMI